MQTTGTRASASDYLAAERTYLAWIRTALALMGFGFVAAKFNLFLRALQPGGHPVAMPVTGLSAWIGTALLLLGVAVAVLSTWNHIEQVHSLNRGEADFARPSRLGVFVAMVLALAGLTMAIYLIP